MYFPIPLKYVRPYTLHLHYSRNLEYLFYKRLHQLYNYIVVTLLAPENAMRQYNRIADAILRLDILPERFREIGSEFGRAEKLRRMVVDNYSVFYVIQEESVIVTDVLYSASDIEYRLKK